MSHIKRYEPTVNCSEPDMVEHHNGDWVRFDEITQASQDIRILLAQIDYLQDAFGEELSEEDAGIVMQIRQNWAATEALTMESCVSEWQPIETAPKDGTYIILARLDGEYTEVCGGDWNLYPKKGQEGLHGFEAWLSNPTHWMPLPSPPK